MRETHKAICLNDIIKNNNNKDKNEVKKSKTYKIIDNKNKRNNINLHINNDKPPNHLETVVETINEISYSKIDSSHLNEGSENKNINNNNIIINLNNNIDIKEVNENLFKSKNEYNFNSEQRVQYSENTTSALATIAKNNTKKSLYFLKSEKTD